MSSVATPLAKWTNYGQMRPVLVRKFLGLVAVRGPQDCWEWRGDRDPKGYGKVVASHGGRKIVVSAHRVAYLLDKYTIDASCHIDHLCRNRVCCNPAHLEAVTPRENIRRGLLVALKTECKNGHPWTAENITTYQRRGRGACNTCRICRDQSIAKYRAKRRDAVSAER